MNQKLPFHELAELYAEVCGVSHENAESFLKLFFEALSECIINGQDVTIKGVGSFTRSDNADNPVAFEPAPELARSINAPFALFEPEVLAPDATDEALDAVALEPLPEPEPEPIPEPEPEPEEVVEEVVEEEVSEAESNSTTDDEPAEGDSIAESALSEEEAEAEPEVETETVTEPETEQTVEQEVLVEESAEEVVSQKESQAEVVKDDAEPESMPEVELTAVVEETVITEEPKPIEEPAPEPKPAPVASRPSHKYGTIPSKPAEIAEDEEERVATTERRRHHRRRSNIHSYESHSSNSGFGLGFFAGLIVGLAIGACSVYFAIDYLFPNRSAAVEEDMIEVIEEQPATPVTDTISSVDTVATAAPAPQPVAEPAPAAAPTAEAKAKAPVVDVIAKGYLLNDMAKKHFGNKAFWVYIYEENKAKIKNPNAMQPGDKLVIPDAAKYGIDASNPASVKAANDMAGKILSRFPR